MKKILAIITARGDSKRIKNKNIKQFNGKPLIYWSIRAAKKSKMINNLDIFVTSDSKKILNISRKYGVNTILRPKKLANNKIMPDAAIKHAINFINKKYDTVVFLQPTNPLRKNNDIDNALASFQHAKADSLISAYKTKNFMWKRKKNKFYEPVNYNYLKRPRSQEFLNYIEDGSIYIFKTNIFLKDNNRLGGKVSIFEIDNWQSVDIDNLGDFKKAEKIFKKKLKYK